MRRALFRLPTTGASNEMQNDGAQTDLSAAVAGRSPQFVSWPPTAFSKCLDLPLSRDAFSFVHLHRWLAGLALCPVGF